MSDDTTNNFSIINTSIPDSIDNAAKNLTDLPTKGIGQTLSDCWYLIFGGISQLADKKRAKYTVALNTFKKELESSIDSVPEEYRREPNSHVVLSALDNSKFCVEEEELRKLYINLLTSATDARKTVHPSFSQIILQMNHTDAVILNQFKNEYYLPICDYKTTDSNTTDYKIHYRNIFLDKPNDIDITDTSISIDSLCRLGLLEIPADLHLTAEGIYDNFINTPLFHQMIHMFPDRVPGTIQKTITKTNLGSTFISCCLG